MKKTFESMLNSKLESLGVSEKDILFISSLIHSSDQDENLKIMNNDVYQRLEKKELLEVFEKACKELKIEFTHNNEPER